MARRLGHPDGIEISTAMLNRAARRYRRGHRRSAGSPRRLADGPPRPESSVYGANAVKRAWQIVADGAAALIKH